MRSALDIKRTAFSSQALQLLFIIATLLPELLFHYLAPIKDELSFQAVIREKTQRQRILNSKSPAGGSVSL